MHFSNPFIFLSLANRRGNKSYDNRTRNNRSNNSRLFQLNSWSEKLSRTPRIRKTSAFFRRQENYQDHSRQLVHEIPKWLQLRNFDECYYGEYGVRLEKGIESYESLGLPYLDYLKLHLEEAYPDVMDLYNKIKMNHADWSHKIRDYVCAGHHIQPIV